LENPRITQLKAFPETDSLPQSINNGIFHQHHVAGSAPARPVLFSLCS
jgi:hypothetical protein